MEQREDKFWCNQAEMNMQSVTLENSCELSLPDYLGEISRLLRVWPRVMPPRRFVSGGSAEFSGRVCYDVLYAGADGQLYHTDVEDTYSFSVPLQEAGAEVCAFLVPDVVVGRVAAPRRLCVRCRMHAQIGVYRKRAVGVALSPEEAQTVCVLGDAVECARHFEALGDTVELQESFELQGREAEIVFSRAEVFLPEAVTAHDAVRCRGEAVVTLLCREATGAAEEGGALPFTLTRTLPFTVEVPVEGVRGEDTARATGVVEGLRAAADGDRVSVSLGVAVQVEVAGRESVPYIKDLYMPYMQSECRAAAQRSWVPTVCKNQNYSLSATPALAEAGLPSGALVIDACADAEIAEKTCKEGQLTVRGSAHCHLLYRTGEEWGVGEVKLPFCVTLEGGHESAAVLATVPICRVQQEQGTLRISAELALALLGGAEVCFSPVQEAHFLPLQESARCDLEFYYPVRGECLWDIARRFALPPEALAVANGLDKAAPLQEPLPCENGYLLLPQH